MIIYWATKLRGFLKHISDFSEEIQFVQKDQFYETSSKLHVLKSRLIRSHIFDPVGLFQIISVPPKECDYYGSFNRFLDCDKPYFIYLENPTALYHYSLGRLRFHAGKRRFKKCLEDPNLKYIACMADACKNTFEKVNMQIPNHVTIETVRPFVPENPNVDEDQIRRLSQNETLECLYCVQGKRFITKGGKDVIEAVSRLQAEGSKIHLTVITNISDLDSKTLKSIEANEGISLHDFSFSYEQLEKIYANTNVLLQPSSDDSCSLTVLEAMKGGCAIVATNLYAFPEMVENNANGYLIEPKFRIFTEENIPNPKCWPRRKKLRYAKMEDEVFVRNIMDAILPLYNDREKLCAFSLRSLEIANSKFGCEKICNQWMDVWNTLKGKTVDEA